MQRAREKRECVFPQTPTETYALPETMLKRLQVIDILVQKKDKKMEYRTPEHQSLWWFVEKNKDIWGRKEDSLFVAKKGGVEG